MKNVTPLQVIVFVACVAAPIAAYKILATADAAAALVFVGMVINFFLGRNDSAPEAK
jgi:hypothetical protein